MATQAPPPWYRTPQFANLLGNVGIGLLVEDDPWVGIGKGLQQAQAQQMQQQLLAQEQARWQAVFDQKERQFQAQIDEGQKDRDFRGQLVEKQAALEQEMARINNDFAMGRIDAQAAYQQALAAQEAASRLGLARFQAGAQLALSDRDFEQRKRLAEQEAQLKQQYPQASGLGFTFEPYVAGDATIQTRQNRATGAVEYLDPQDNQWKPGMPPGNPMRPQDAILGLGNRAEIKQLYEPVLEGGRLAQAAIPELQRAIDLAVSNQQGYWGPGSQGLNQLRSVAVGLGIAPDQAEKVANFEEFAALAGKEALRGLEKIGGNDTDREYARTMDLGGNPASSYQGNIQKLQAALAVKQREAEKATFYMEGRANGKSLVQIEREWRDYTKQNPIFAGLPQAGAGKSIYEGTGISPEDQALIQKYLK